MVNTRQISIRPKDQERNRPRDGKIELWFVGYSILTAQGKSPIVQTKDGAFQLPELGESIKVDPILAKDLRDKTQNVLDPRGKPIPGFLSREEGGAEISQLLKAAQEAGTGYDEIDLDKIRREKVLEEVEDQELYDILKQKGMSIPQELLDSINLRSASAEEESEKPDSTQPKKKVGRPRKMTE